MDMTSISAALASIKAAAEIAKLIKNSDISLERAESKLKFAELLEALADAKIEITEIQQLLLDKDLQIRSLQEQLSVKDHLQWEAPYYWLVDGASKDGPFCPNCYDTDRRLIRLQTYSNNGYWDCTSCKNSFQDNPIRIGHKHRAASLRSFSTVLRTHAGSVQTDQELAQLCFC